MIVEGIYWPKNQIKEEGKLMRIVKRPQIINRTSHLNTVDIIGNNQTLKTVWSRFKISPDKKEKITMRGKEKN